MGVSIKEARKYAYTDIPLKSKDKQIQQAKGIVYRITFTENIFDNVFTTITYDYQSKQFNFGVGVKR